MRKVKCWYCLEKSEQSEMYCDEFSQPRKHYHHSCWPLELERREQVEKEKVEWDGLYKYIKSIYDFPYALPPSFIHILQDLRNGTVRYKGPVQRGYKGGVPYHIIYDAYRMAEQDILRAKSKTETFENDFLKLKYGYSIMMSYLNKAHAQWKRKIESEQRISIAKPTESTQVGYKKKKDDNDISAWVDEE